MKLKIVVISVATLVVFAASVYVSISHETGAPKVVQRQMIGVLISADSSDVETLRAAAKQAGWKHSRHDMPGDLVLLPPPNYKPENITALISAVRNVKMKKVSVHIIDLNGYPQAADLLVDQNNAPTH